MKIRPLSLLKRLLRKQAHHGGPTSEDLDRIKLNQGLLLAKLNALSDNKTILENEFSIFSQWGEDGIIQYLISHIEIGNRTFIEFGVEDFSESNCRFLMMKDNWSGFIIDASESINSLKTTSYFWKHDLAIACDYITKDNINDLVSRSGFDADLGILSIDIDGNDLHVFEAIDAYRPRILICEYNAVFGKDRAISVPYDAGFNRTEKHHSNLYFGCSLPAIAESADRKGYALVACCSAGVNAFFVRSDLLNDHVRAGAVNDIFQPSKFRESRDENGQLSFVSGDDRLELIRGLPVLNTRTGEIEPL